MARRTDAERLRRIERAGGDQHGREADQRVEERHELRHLRHLDAARQNRAEPATDAHADDCEQPRRDSDRRPIGERGEHGDRHADHAVEVAFARRRGMRQATQRQNEKDAGDEIEDGGEGGVHARQPFFLYMESIRSVTRKPPKMFTDARISAMKPNVRAQAGHPRPGSKRPRRPTAARRRRSPTRWRW